MPVETVLFDIVPDHPLFARFPFDDCVAGENHPPALEPAGEIEICAVVIHPRLAPQVSFVVVRRKTQPVQVSAIEMFLNDFIVENSFDMVRAFAIVAPCHIPFANPEIELFFRFHADRASVFEMTYNLPRWIIFYTLLWKVFQKMPILKVATALLISLLPFNFLRVLAYRILLGYAIANSKIGFGTIVAVDKATIQKSRIGIFNLFIGPITVKIADGASIGNRNSFVCGYWVLRKENKDLIYARALDIGTDALITSSHYFDLAGTFKLGRRSWVAGVGSQFWTHGIGVHDRNIEIGEGCYLGSAVRFAPGSTIGNNVLVAMGSVVSGKIETNDALVGGIPAKVLKENYDWKTEHAR